MDHVTHNPLSARSFRRFGRKVLKTLLVLFVLISLQGPYTYIGAKPASAANQIPKILNYQARITNAAGVPVPDGNLNIWISVYNASSGGSCLYAMRGTCGTPSFKNVTVVDGVFSTLIGDTANGDVEIPESLFDNNTLFLGVTVASDTEMVPRKRIAASPYALNADKLDDLDLASSGSTTPYVVGTTVNGNLVITGDPQGGTVTSGSLSINPGSASASETLFGIADNGTSRFLLDKEGDLTHLGSLLATAASSTAQFIFKGAASQSQNIFEVQTNLTNRMFAVSATATTIGSTSSTDAVVFNSRVGSNLTPTTDAAFDLGDYNRRWRDLWLSGGSANIAYDTSGTSVMRLGFETTQGLRGVMKTPSNIPLQIKVGNSDAGSLYLNTNGRVGIGTTAPVDFFEVRGPNVGTGIRVDAGGDHYAGFTAKNTTITWNWQITPTSDAPAGRLRLVSVGGTTDERVAILTSGNFGIGDINPAALFTVGNGDRFQVDASGNLNWPSAATFTLQGVANALNIDGGTLSVDALNNRVGIGTSTPGDRLEVTGSTSGGVTATIRNNDASGYSGTVFNEGATAKLYLASIGSTGTVYAGGANAAHIWNVGNGPTLLATNNLERVRITADGRVGIGNTAPANLLTVGSATSTFEVNSAGNLVKVNNVAYSWPSSQGGASTVLTNNGSGALSWVAAGSGATLQTAYDSSTGTTEIFLGSARGALTLADSFSSFGGNLFEIQDRTNGAGDYSRRFMAVSATSTLLGLTSAGGALSGYEVGIGTASPTARLHVVPDANTTALQISGFSTTGLDVMADFAGTWNTALNAVAFRVNMTDVASGGQSQLIQAQTNGITRFFADKLGKVGSVTHNGSIVVPGSSNYDLRNDDPSTNNFASITFSAANNNWGSISGQYLSHAGNGQGNILFSVRDNADVLATRLTIGATTTSITNDFSFDGSGTFGNASSTDSVIFNSRIGSNLTPTTDATFDLGDYNRRWRDLWLSGGSANIAYDTSGTSILQIGWSDAEGRRARLFSSSQPIQITPTLARSGGINIAATGSVGVGTSAPSAKLSVFGLGGRPFDWGDTFALGALTFDGTNPLIQAQGSSSLLFHVGGAERVRMTNTGNVGIGTTAPGARLTVADANASPTANILEVQNSTNSSRYFTVSSTATTIIDVSSSPALILKPPYTAGAAEDSPTIQFFAKRADESESNFEIGATVGFDLVIKRNGATAAAFPDGSRIHFGDGSVAGPAYSFLSDGDTGMYRFGTNTLGFVTGASTRLVIDADGDAGIGNTAPANRLTVGSATSTFEVDAAGNLVKVNNVPYSWPASQGGASTVLTNNGSGVLSWTAASSLATLQTAYDSSTGTTEIFLGSARGALTLADSFSSFGGNLFEIQDRVNGAGDYSQRYFTVSSTSTLMGFGPAATITGYEVGIGTGSPTARLHVVPDVNTSAFQVSGASFTGSNAGTLVSLAGTWNTSGAPIGILLNITDTASSGNGALMMLQQSGIARFNINKSGATTITLNNALPITGTSALSLTNSDLSANNFSSIYFGDGLGVGSIISNQFLNHGVSNVSNVIFQTRDNAGTLATRMTIGATGTSIVGDLSFTGTCTSCSGSVNLNQAYLNSTSTTEIYVTGSRGALTIADTFSGTGNIFEIQDRTNAAGDYSQRYFTVSSTATSSTVQYLASLGNGGAPAYSFIGDTNTGIYGSGADVIAVSVGGGTRLRIGDLGTEFTGGTSAAPGLKIFDDTNTGIFGSTADILGITAGGLSVATFSTTSTTIGSGSSTYAVDFRARIGSNLTPTTDATFDLGDYNRRWKDLWLSGGSAYVAYDQSGSSVLRLGWENTSATATAQISVGTGMPLRITNGIGAGIFMDEQGNLGLGSTNTPEFLTIGSGKDIFLVDDSNIITPYVGFGRFMNPLRSSSDFGNSAWVKESTTVTTNTTVAPDNTLTADTITGTAGGHAIRGTSTGFSVGSSLRFVTFSVWLRSPVNSNISIDLRIDGSLSGAGTVKTVQVTPHWQRFSVTQNASGNTTPYIVTGAQSVIAWGGQLEKGTTMGPYLGSATDISTGTPMQDPVQGIAFSSEQGGIYFAGTNNAINFFAPPMITLFHEDGDGDDAARMVLSTSTSATSTGMAFESASNTFSFRGNFLDTSKIFDIDIDGFVYSYGDTILGNDGSSDNVFVELGGNATTPLTIDVAGVTSSQGVTINAGGATTGSALKINATAITTGGALLIDAGTGAGNNYAIRINNVSDHFTVSATGTIRANLPISVGSFAICHNGNNGAGTVQTFTDCASTPVADYMEMYPAAAGLEVGDIVMPGTTMVMAGGASVPQVVKTTFSYEGTMLGVMSDPNEATDFNSIGHNVPAEANPKPVALKGRVKVKVNMENGAIKVGDPITSSSVPGVGMKSTKPGMIVGQALNEWNGPGQGTVLVFMGNGFHSGLAITTDGLKSLFNDDFSFLPKAYATSLQTAIASRTLSFTGNAWNAASSTSITRSITLGNVMTDISNYQMAFKNDVGQTLATLNQVGDLALAGSLSVNGGFDYAEMFPATPDIEAGDIVMVDPDDANGYGVKKTQTAYENSAIGVISTKPGFLTGDRKEEDAQPVALAGRVPVKVNLEGGEILPGDPITSSSIPGIGMKATEAGRVIGIALQRVSAEGVALIFVNPSWWNGPAPAGEATAGSGLAITQDSLLDFKNSVLSNVAAIISTNGLWGITSDGQLVAQKVEAKTIQYEEAVVVQSDTKASAAEGTVPAGYDAVVVHNPSMKANSKVFVMFMDDPGGGYWVKEKGEGNFTLHLAKSAINDLPFEYWILGIDDRRPEIPDGTPEATPPPVGPDPTLSGSTTPETGPTETGTSTPQTTE